VVGDCELYIVPWSSGEEFFIDTQREFDRRRGILSLPPEVIPPPAPAPDISEGVAAEALQAAPADFRQHSAVLRGEDKEQVPVPDTNAPAISEIEFADKMTELIPGADAEGIRGIIEYAKELDEAGTEPRGKFFKDTLIEYYLVSKQYGQEIALQLIDLCKTTFMLNPFELRGAAHHLKSGVAPGDIEELAYEGQCDPHTGSLIAEEALKEYEESAAVKSSGAEFFIDTQREIDRRRGVLRLTPGVMDMVEKDGDIYVAYKFDGFHGETAFSGENYKQFASGPLTDADTLDTIRAKHSLPPTSVITFRRGDELTAWYVDALAYSKIHGFFSEPAPELIPPPKHAPDISEGVAVAALRERLFERLDANLNAYRDSVITDSTKTDIFDMAREIAARYAARECLKTGYDYKTGEVEYLLQFQDPLSLIAASWPDLHELGGMSDIIGDILEDKDSHGHFARVMDADSPASKENARSPADNEKQSVLARIREAERAPKKPRADKTKHDRSHPER
jgi:hypothetical protein